MARTVDRLKSRLWNLSGKKAKPMKLVTIDRDDRVLKIYEIYKPEIYPKEKAVVHRNGVIYFEGNSFILVPDRVEVNKGQYLHDDYFNKFDVADSYLILIPMR